eukprot:3324928-Pleurochrysis_carterae.AAC.1
MCVCLFVGLSSRVVGRRGSYRCVSRMSDRCRGYGFGRMRRETAGRYRGCLGSVVIVSSRSLESGIASQRGDRLSNV